MIAAKPSSKAMRQRTSDGVRDRAGAPPRGRILQRKCACGKHVSGGGECAGCKNGKTLLQRKTGGGRVAGIVPPIVGDVLRSPGRPLERQTQDYFEQRFQHDLSGVRVHTDPHAARSAQAVDARAYTVGRDIVFSEGTYDPQSRQGRGLLAHELTHVIQQGRGAPHDHMNAVELENAADSVARQIVSSENSVHVHGASPIGLAKQDDRATFGNLGDGIPGPATRIVLQQEGETWMEVRPNGEKWRATGTYAFVIQKGKIWAVKPSGAVGANRGHTEAAAGGRVEFAGLVTFGSSKNQRGIVREWSNESGHYLPVRDFKNVALAAGLPEDRFKPFKGPREPGGPQAQLPVFQEKGNVTLTKAGERRVAPVSEAETPASAPKVQAGVPEAENLPAGSPSGSGKVASELAEHVEEPSVSPKIGGGALRGIAFHVGVTGATVLLGIVQAHIKAKLDSKEIQKDLAERWPDAQRQIESYSPQITELQQKPGTAKIFAVIEITILRGRSFNLEGEVESVAHVDSMSVTGVGVQEVSREENTVMEPDVLMATFNRKSEMTFSVVLWDRAQAEAAAERERRAREQREIARKLEAAAKATSSPPAVRAPTSAQPLLAPPGTAPAPKVDLLPGAPGEGPLEKAAAWAASAEAVGRRLVERGEDLERRISSSNPPAPGERASFLRDESVWRLAVKYQLNWSVDNAPSKAVQDLKQLLEDPAKPGPRLDTLRVHIGG